MRLIVATALLLAAVASHSASLPYDEAADAKAEIRASLEKASKAKVPVLVVFGANGELGHGTWNAVDKRTARKSRYQLRR